MQATVAGFDEERRDGWLLRDDGRRLEFSAAAFAESGLRLLRIGQRVKVEVSTDGEVSRVTIATMPWPTPTNE